LYSDYWLYLGFSAAGLENDPNYLGLLNSVPRSLGATSVAFPGRPKLGAGAKTLMTGYGGIGDVVNADIGHYLAEIHQNISEPRATVDPEVTKSGGVALPVYRWLLLDYVWPQSWKRWGNRNLLCEFKIG